MSTTLNAPLAQLRTVNPGAWNLVMAHTNTADPHSATLAHALATVLLNPDAKATAFDMLAEGFNAWAETEHSLRQGLPLLTETH